MRPQLPATVGAIADAVTASTPAFAAIESDKFHRDVRGAVLVALERFLDLIGTDEPALPPHVREVFVALGAGEARENRGPEALLAAVRLATRLMLRTAAASLAPADSLTVIDLSDAISAYADELAAAATEGFALQVREQAGEGDRRRRQLAEVLLRGDAPPSAVATAAAGIGWRTLLGVVPVLLPLDQAREARFRYATDGVVLERERDAVLLVRDGPRAARTDLASLVERGAVVAPMLDWSRTPEGVRLAERTASLVGPGAFVEDHLAGLALQGEAGALELLADRRLAPLATLRRSQREGLLATLQSWLRHWGSRADVAAELFVHPQTVSYRLKRLRDLLGDDLDDPTVRFELQLVLASQTRTPGT
jgi:DNA-binding PucR family transcriptional regulator